ncbi:O-antigen ligase [uncultured Clostridium sp.]|uniref:O-antigen ligase family protein n=1 Tax=uncultured Clostridium sp. TaxID=59620 RepID=UPI002594A191|nr:hypothetical protein [uncultured Clostridium sp.]
MSKKLDNIIALVMVLYLICVFFNKFVAVITMIFCILLMIRVLRDKRIVPIILSVIVLGLLFYNYFISMQYFVLELEVLSNKSNLEYLIRMITFIMMLYCFSDREILISIYNEFENYINIVLVIVIIYQIVIGVFLITKQGFLERWGMTIFVGINGNPHGNTYLMILMAIVIEIIISKKDNRYLVLYFIPLLSAFMSGARTPAIVLLGMFLGIRCFKNRIRANLRFTWKGLLITTVFLIVISIFSHMLVEFILHSSIIDKFLSTSDSGNMLNSRDLIWNGLINDFKYNFSDIERVFGHGIHYSVIINEQTVNSPIWGHSDFIDILISYGIIMLVIYVVMYVRYFIKLWTIGGKGLLIMVFFVGMVLLSVFNGVINYTVFISIIAFWSIFYISIEDKDIDEGKCYE